MARLRIFISYRREDSAGHAGRLYDRLAEHFGADRVYRDIDAATAGEDFGETIRRRVEECDVMLALIGPRWLAVTDTAGGWRLAQKNDWVRQEITIALKRGVRVIPVLLQGAKMPGAGDLPAALAKLARHNAVEIRDTHFDRDVAHLVDALGPSWRYSAAMRKLSHPLVWSVPAVVLVVGALAAVYISQVSLTPEQARARLTQLDLPYSPAAFVKSAERGDEQAIDLFLKAGMSVDAKDRNGNTALAWASSKGQIELMKTLLKKGADPNIALSWAAANGQAEALELLLRQPGITKAAINEALVSAARSNQPDIARKLIDRGADVNYQGAAGFTPLMKAAYRGDTETVRLLLSRGADVKRTNDTRYWKGWTALHAVGGEEFSRSITRDEARLIEIARLLLDKGAEIDARSLYVNEREGGLWTPLLVALGTGQWSVARFLVERGADVNARTDAKYEPTDRTALMWAVEAGETDLVSELIGRGADVNAANSRGETPLAMAAQRQSAPLVDQLLARGAAVDAVNGQGWTALMHAVNGRGARPTIHSPMLGGPIAARLIEKGANIHARTSRGGTALIIAAEKNEREAVDVLLAHGADINAANDKGYTALITAAWAGNADIVRALLAKGADVRAKNVDGDTALDVARKEKSDDVVPVLARASGGQPTRTARR